MANRAAVVCVEGRGGRTVGAEGEEEEVEKEEEEEEGCSGELPSPGSVVVFRRYSCSPASLWAAGGCGGELKHSEGV